MAKLSDEIEKVILSMLKESDSVLNLQRNEMAEQFNCVPSQINYVIATRFTQDKGYIVESRKGGGGYVRIIKTGIEADEFLESLITIRIKDKIAIRECRDIMFRLRELNYVSDFEKSIILAALSDFHVNVSKEDKDTIRAGILKNILLTILYEKEGKLL